MTSPGLPFSVSLGVGGAVALLLYLQSRDTSRRMDEQFDRFVRTDAILTKALENYTKDLRDLHLLRKVMDSPALKDNGNGKI